MGKMFQRSPVLLTRLVVATWLAAGCGIGSAQQAGAPSAAVDSAIEASRSAMMTSPEVALTEAQRAEGLSQALEVETERTVARATAQWLQGEALARLNRLADARPIIDSALQAVEQVQPGSKLNGDLLLSRAALSPEGGVSDALQDLQDAYRVFLSIGAQRSQAIALQNIGSIYADAGDYDRVLHYYDQAAEAFHGDASLDLSAHNNRGWAYKELGRFQEAEAEYRAALEQARGMGSDLLIVRILTNIAQVQILAGAPALAAETIESAMPLAVGEAAGWAPFLWGVKAQAAAARGQFADADHLLRKTFAGQDMERTALPFRDFHRTARDVYKALGSDAEALAHLEAFQRLDSEARAVMTSTKSALLSAQFDFANQQLSISNLKAGQLERDIKLAESQSRFLFTALGAATLIAILSFAGFVQIKRSRNQIRRTNTSLNEANDALGRALAARTEFLAMTSHELRTPLNGILGMTQFLLGSREADGPLRQHVETIHGAGKTMKALVDDILDVARIERGELSLSPSRFHAPDIVTDSCRLWAAEASRKGLALSTETTTAPTYIRADEQRLRQIVFNLLANAIKFTDTGEVKVTATTDILNDQPALIVRVADSGIGIPEDKYETIFHAFQQVDASISRRFGGTGLGLAICRNLARLMGGDISVSSGLGKGSVFTLIVPFEPAPTEAPAPSPGGEVRGVLVASPNPLTREMLKAALLPRFGSVAVASDTDALATDMALAGVTHLVIDAAALPADELASMAVLRGLATAGDRSVTVLLPAEQADKRSAYLGCGARHVLMRPIAIPDLLSVLSDDASSQAARDREAA